MFHAFLVLTAFCFGGDLGNLVLQLGDEDFATREKAHAALQGKMDFSLYVKLREIKADNLEANGRLKSINDAYAQKFWENLRPRFKVDLMGYPKYPWILQGFSHSYKWEGLGKTDITNRYVGRAKEEGIAGGNCEPDWTYWRRATELWLAHRVDTALMDTIRTANSEEEVCKKMDEFMKGVIQVEVRAMIWGEDKHWGDRPNPLREANKKR